MLGCWEDPREATATVADSSTCENIFEAHDMCHFNEEIPRKHRKGEEKRFSMALGGGY